LDEEEDREAFSLKKPGKIHYLWEDNKLFITLETGAIHGAATMKIVFAIGDVHGVTLEMFH